MVVGVLALRVLGIFANEGHMAVMQTLVSTVSNYSMVIFLTYRTHVTSFPPFQPHSQVSPKSI